MASVISIAYLQPRQVEKFEPPIARQRGVCRGHPDDGPLAAERCDLRRERQEAFQFRCLGARMLLVAPHFTVGHGNAC